MRSLTLTALAGCLAAVGCNQEFGNFGGFWRGGSTDEAREARPVDDATGMTILLSTFRDPAAHVRDAQQFKQTLIGKTGWEDMFVVHKEGYSALFWGRYPSVDAAQDNLKTAKAYRSPAGARLFVQAIVVPLPGKDLGPPEWNLKNAEGAFTLLVAVFKDDPGRDYVGRRRRAVDACRGLREKGYEAYYHHGPAVSNVTLGAFDPGAVRLRKVDGKVKQEIRDPRIRELQREFPHLVLNGNTITDVQRDPRTGAVIGRRMRRTYVTGIPRSR